jgi:hypothetical protein
MNNRSTRRPKAQRPVVKKAKKQAKQSRSKKLDNRNIDKIFGVEKSFPAPQTLSLKKKSNISLSECALKYALAIADPFHPDARNACLPVYPSVPSQKVTGFGRFNVVIGTAGTGFLSIHPTIANNGGAVMFTNVAYTQTSLSWVTATNVLQTGVTVGSMTNLPYNISQLDSQYSNGGPSVFGRVVSVGVRVTYTGTTLNESGQYYLYMDPSHQNMTIIGNSLTALGNLSDCDVCGITRAPCEASLYPVNAFETSYLVAADGNPLSQSIYPYSGGFEQLNGGTFSFNSVNMGIPVGLVAMTGVPGSTFLVEVIEHVEYSGPSTAALQTQSDADQHGFEIVSAAAARLPTMKQASPKGASTLSLIGNAIKEVAYALKPLAVDTFIKAAGSFLL